MSSLRHTPKSHLQPEIVPNNGRRTFLRGGSAAAVAALLQACGGNPSNLEPLKFTGVQDIIYTLPDEATLQALLAGGQQNIITIELPRADGNTITYEVTGLPPGISYDASTHTVTVSLAQISTLPSFQFSLTANSQGRTSSIRPVVTINRPPVFANLNIETKMGVTKEVTLSATDPDNNPLVYSITQPTNNGTLTLVGNTLTYVPNPGFVGADTATIQVSDGKGGTTRSIVSITVTSLTPTLPATLPDIRAYDNGGVVPVSLTISMPPMNNGNGQQISYQVSGLPTKGANLELANWTITQTGATIYISGVYVAGEFANTIVTIPLTITSPEATGSTLVNAQIESV